MKEKRDGIDGETWDEDDDDGRESGEEMAMKEEEIGGDGGVREEWRHLYSPLTLTLLLTLTLTL